ncbi:GNAT family N-acetyltransferase [Devosia neptuniae]|uniref:GNAT family N-acetyltransferase n=1 Tax=Devosia neptuniae TaxID=191302 RepID=A0ABY6C9P5_9HYPH|nr:GNAT family N-acetyltransferase [Devosia neptuniae]UXN68956.1 GNAT family N-acetyltransferase [Devosia neptuniae]
MSIICAQETGLTAEEYIACVGQSALGPTRPLSNTERVQAYLDSSNIIVTARDTNGTLVGLFRGMTDWNWVCYCADLAVAESYQGKGIGGTLMDKAAEVLGPGVTIALLSLPGAEGFYKKIGLTQTDAAFYRDRTHRS